MKKKTLKEIYSIWKETKKMQVKPASYATYVVLAECHVIPDLGHLYDIPEEVNLYELFHNGFGVAVEEEDKNFVKEQEALADVEIIKLPREKMDSVTADDGAAGRLCPGRDL